MPKIFGRSNPERTSIAVIKAVNAVGGIFRPFMFPWRKTYPSSRFSSFTVEDIRAAVGEVLMKDGVEPETTLMLERILDFPALKAGDVMIPASRVSAVDISGDSASVAGRLAQAGHAQIPVYSGDKNRITGVVLLKELIDSRTGSVRFSEDIVRPVINVNPRQKVGDILREFQKGITHCAVVTNKKGVFKGIVILDDILKKIIGELSDEYEHARKKSGGGMR